MNNFIDLVFRNIPKKFTRFQMNSLVLGALLKVAVD